MFLGKKMTCLWGALKPTKGTCRQWRAVDPIGCGVLESTCRHSLTPFRKLTKKASSGTNHVDLLVNTDALHSGMNGFMSLYFIIIIFKFVCLLYTGNLISLKDPELALAVEVCLKNLLQAFTCDNHEDEKMLQGLMTKVFPAGRRPPIITSHFLPYVHDTRKRWVEVTFYVDIAQSLVLWVTA